MNDGRWRLERGRLCVVPLHRERGAFDREKRPWPILPCQSATDPPKYTQTGQLPSVYSECCECCKEAPHSPLYGRRKVFRWHIYGRRVKYNLMMWWWKFLHLLAEVNVVVVLSLCCHKPHPSWRGRWMHRCRSLVFFYIRTTLKSKKSSDVILIPITISKRLLYPLRPSPTSSCLDPPGVK